MAVNDCEVFTSLGSYPFPRAYRNAWTACRCWTGNFATFDKAGTHVKMLAKPLPELGFLTIFQEADNDRLSFLFANFVHGIHQERDMSVHWRQRKSPP